MKMHCISLYFLNFIIILLFMLLLLSIFQSTLGRLSKLKITCCNKVVLSKMDALGENFDKPLKSAQKMIEAQSIKKAELLANIKENIHSSEKVEELKEELESHLKSSHEGLVVGFDNTDMHLQRRNMTSTNQNTDIHWVNHNMFLNRVSGNLLPHINRPLGMHSV